MIRQAWPRCRCRCRLAVVLLAVFLGATPAGGPVRGQTEGPEPAARETGARLVLDLHGIRNANGLVRIAIFDRAGEFPEGEEIRKIAVPATPGSLQVVTDGLAPGRYAIAFFHDADGDDRFRTNFLGLPREGFGFSRDPVVFLSAPDFEDAAISLEGPETTVSATMKYW